MLIRDKKHFMLGLTMGIGFFIVLWYMFTPSFGGENAFHASDRLFNSISKGSIHYVPALKPKAEALVGKQVTLRLFKDDAEMAEVAAPLLAKMGAEVDPGAPLTAKLDLGVFLGRILDDADAMYYNKGDVLTGEYGLGPKQAAFVQWNIMNQVERDLKRQKMFPEAAAVATIQAKAVELGYNYYGVTPQDAGSEAGILTFSLVFYVIYTLWWGYSIFFLSEGFGLQMKKGSKKEA